MTDLLSKPVQPDYEAFLKCLRRQGTPERVHFIELFLDAETQDAILDAYSLREGLDPDDPFVGVKQQILLQRFLGYDTVTCGLEGWDAMTYNDLVEDYGPSPRQGGRSFVNEHKGPITNWAEFERYPWPDPDRLTSRNLEYLQEHLPDDMCIIGGLVAHYAEWLSWLMGYETLCYALADERDLVAAIVAKATALYDAAIDRMLEFPRVEAIFGSDDMGHRSGPLIGPNDLREFVLPGHKRAAAQAHAAGKLYLLHSCGKLDTIMDDLLDDVQIDAKHSYEDTIVGPIEFKRMYGDRIAVLGGIDVDFLCRTDEAAVRSRVRETLDACHPGGGYCLGTGNSVANYIPLRSYLAMLDEGRRY